MASDDVARTMGRGLTRLESYLPSVRGATLFGEVKRMLDRPGAAQRAVEVGAHLGATGAGRFAQHVNENSRTFWERHFYVSARKRAEEAEAVEALAQLGGLIGSFIAGKAVQYVDKKAQEGVARVIWQVVGFAARADDGTVNEYNQALLWRVLDASQLDARARTQLGNAPLPTSYPTVEGIEVDAAAREAIATYAFHAKANEVGVDRAVREIVPLLIRLGMSKSAGDHFATKARAEYLSERASMTHHHRALMIAIAGTGRHLRIPYETIERAARRVILFDPYEAARAENRRLLAQFMRSTAGMAAALSGGHIGPAMSIATVAAQRLFGTVAASQPAVEGAFVSFGQDAGLAAPSVQSWLAWNQT